MCACIFVKHDKKLYLGQASMSMHVCPYAVGFLDEKSVCLPVCVCVDMRESTLRSARHA